MTDDELAEFKRVVASLSAAFDDPVWAHVGYGLRTLVSVVDGFNDRLVAIERKLAAPEGE
jgi:hypothetical protein